MHIIVAGQGLAASPQETSHRHEFVQVTAPHAEPSSPPPWHVTSQRPWPQPIVPHAPAPPEHDSVQRPDVHVIGAMQALAPVHVRSQSPVVQDSEPHTCESAPPEQVCLQSPVVHDRSPHAFAPLHIAVQAPVVQSMSPQAFAPVHSTSHGLVLHVMSPHPPAPHVMSHDCAAVQVIASHEPAVGQLMSQFQPLGQVTALPLPVIVHVSDARSHESHVLGHSRASGMRASGVPTMQ